MDSLEYLTTWILILAVAISAQKLQPPGQKNGLQLECLGNLMRLSLDKPIAVESHLEIDAINGTDFIPLTPSLAAQCGYSVESDPWGNTIIYSSLLGCYVDNQEDETFNLELQLSVYGNSQSVQDSYYAAKECNHASWASNEILCDRNYMEVSTGVTVPVVPVKTVADLKDDSWIDSIGDILSKPVTSPNEVFQVTFFTPEAKTMTLEEAQKAGYGLRLTPTRLVMRSPFDTRETYSEEVFGVPMEVFRTAAYYIPHYGLHVVELKAACPTGGVIFSEDVITWRVPHRITPVIGGAISIVEMHMGIDGKRLDKATMDARQYSLTKTNSHVIVTLPMGSPDGYFKSHAPDDQYHITFTIEPMLELLWREERTKTNTRYKVLFPITTPLMPQIPEVIDHTVPEDRVFAVQLGLFLHDVELVNITFSTGVLSVAECNARGFNVREHGTTPEWKSFSLTVPFDDEVVIKHNPEPLVTTYSLPLIYGLLIHPEETPFSHPAEVKASLQDVVLPEITGTCDQENFFVTVKYGNQGANFQTIVGNQDLTAEMYELTENSTHFNLVIPYISLASIFELVKSTSVRARIDVQLWDTTNNWKLNDFSLSCNFPLTTTECFSNGTMSALAFKVESVPNMIPSQLTLRDRSCKPDFSDLLLAFFIIPTDACGTTRKFIDNTVLYENEITSYHAGKSSVEPLYRHTVSCVYQLNDTQTVVFRTQSREKDPIAEPGQGQLMVEMRLAKDASYGLFYRAEDHPVVKFLKDSLYFEVALTESVDPQMKLVVENCWATLREDRTSLPNWDLIVDGCENVNDHFHTLYYPVTADARVPIPAHAKRFSVKMFTFVTDEVVEKDQIFIHCDAVICETNDHAGICSGQCTRSSGYHRGLRSVDSQLDTKQISFGPILLDDQ